MSAVVEALVAAWRIASPETRELSIRLLIAAHAFNRAIAVPPGEIGFGDSPEPPNLNPEVSAELLRAELERYEGQARRYQGLPLDVLFAVRAATGVVPAWPAIERLARERGGAGIVEPVSELRAAYGELLSQRASLGGALDSTPAQVWLYGRLQLIQRQPEGGSNAGKWLLALAAAWWLFGGEKR